MNRAWMYVASLTVGLAFGQTPERPQHGNIGAVQTVGLRSRGSTSNGPVGASSGFWLERKVTNPEFMQKVGITEEQATKIREAWKLIEEQNLKLEEDIHQLARQQAELVKKALSEEGSDTTDVMDVIEKIGKLRVEQAKLAMKRVIFIRDHLTPDQRKKLGKLLEEDQKKWRAARDEMVKRREHTPEATSTPKK